jgi:hypothetical protein
VAQPSIVVQIAFTTAPGATPSWTAVTAYTLGFTIQRGRAHELDQFQAGTATVRLQNHDRRFEPLYASGAYYPNVVPLRRIRIQATWNAVTYDLFHGYIERWQPSYPGVLDSECEVTAVDGFSVLAAATINGDYTRQFSGARIGAVLDAISWPAGDRALATGINEVQARTLVNDNALNHLQAVALAENGYLWMNPSGVVTFRNRASRVQLPITTHVTLGDGGGSEELYTDAVWDYDTAHLYNEVRVTPRGGTEQTASDSTSQTAYYRRTLVLSDTEHAEDGDASTLAQLLMTTYKDPQYRAKTITLDATSDPTTLWPHLLGRDIGDRISVAKRPPGGGTALTQVSWIEGVSFTWTADGGVWEQIAWTVTPADTQTYWHLDDATYGVLDSTTRLWW